MPRVEISFRIERTKTSTPIKRNPFISSFWGWETNFQIKCSAGMDDNDIVLS